MRSRGYRHIRLKGFTILEAVITMVLTGLVVLFAYSGIRYYYQLFHTVTDVGQKQTEINLLNMALASDMTRAEKVVFDNALECISGSEVVSYSFMKDYLVRHNGLSADTFHIKHNPLQIVASDKNSELVGQITVECINHEMLYPISISKDYPLGITFDDIK